MNDILPSWAVGLAFVPGLALAPLHVCLLSLTPRRGAKSVALAAAVAAALLLYVLLLSTLAPTEVGDVEIFTDLMSAAFVFGVFVIGYVEFYSLINRGYTLSILTELASRHAAPTVDELVTGYSGDRGLEWMLRKRLHGLVSLGLVRYDNNDIVLTQPRGSRLASMVVLLLDLFDLQKSG